MEKNDPVNSLDVESTCHSLAWRPNARTENKALHDRRFPALIAWLVSSIFFLSCFAFYLIYGCQLMQSSPVSVSHSSGLGNGSIVVWTPLAKDANPQYLKEHKPKNGRAVINDLLFSPDGRKLVSHVCSGDLVVWCTKVTSRFFVNIDRLGNHFGNN